MPLARQTSRIVWPSWPSTTRPSTSSRNAGVESGRSGAWAVIRCSACDSSSGVTVLKGVLASGRLSTRPALSFHVERWFGAGRSKWRKSTVSSPWSAMRVSSSEAVAGATGLVDGACSEPGATRGSLEGGALGLGRWVSSRTGRLGRPPGPGHGLWMAETGGASVTEDVGVELCAEVADYALEGKRGATLMVAKSALDDVVRKVKQAADVVAARLAVAEPGADFGQASQPDTARNGLPASLVGAEAGQDGRQIHHAAMLVDYHDRTGAQMGAGLLEVLVVENDVEAIGREDAARRTADQHGLESMRGRDGAGHVDDLAESDSERDLGDAGVGDHARKLDQHRPGESPGRCLVETGQAAVDDRRHRRESLRAVNQGRRPEQTARHGVWRLLFGLAALALQALEQDRFLAQHIRALKRLDRDVDLCARAEDATAEIARFFSRGDGSFKNSDGIRRLDSNGHDDLARADGEGGDCRALQDGERVVLEQDAVREDGRIGLVGIDHHVVLVGRCGRADAPLLANAGAASRAGTAAAQHPRLGDGLDHAGRIEFLHCRAQTAEGARFHGRGKVGGISRQGCRQQQSWEPGRGRQDGCGCHTTLPPAVPDAAVPAMPLPARRVPARLRAQAAAPAAVTC